MLMIALVCELVKSPPLKPHSVALFFCQNTDPRLNTVASILRGLVKRLTMESVQLADIFHTMSQSKSNQLNGPNTIYVLFSMLSAMLESYPEHLFLLMHWTNAVLDGAKATS
jgi:hypothetical protein